MLISTFSTIFSFLDELEEEEAVQPLSKEEEEVDVMRSWVEMGAFQPIQRRKPRGYCQRQVCSPVPPSPFLALPFN